MPWPTLLNLRERLSPGAATAETCASARHSRLAPALQTLEW